MTEKAKKAIDPPVVCRACGRLESGQDPNVVGRKFLAKLVGKVVAVAFPDGEDPLRGVLRSFDNYSLLIEADGAELLILKGPGIVVAENRALSK